MAITRKPPKSVDDFVSAAPDGGGRKGVVKGKKEQITLTCPPDLLVRIDAAAKKYALSRASAFNQAAIQWLERLPKD